MTTHRLAAASGLGGARGRRSAGLIAAVAIMAVAVLVGGWLLIGGSSAPPPYSFDEMNGVAFADAFEARTLDDLVVHSDLVLVGEVTAVEVGKPVVWDEDAADDPDVPILYSMTVVTPIKGNLATGETFVMRKEDGWAGGRARAGQVGVFFLGEHDDGTFGPVSNGGIAMESAKGLVANTEYDFMKEYAGDASVAKLVSDTTAVLEVAPKAVG